MSHSPFSGSDVVRKRSLRDLEQTRVLNGLSVSGSSLGTERGGCRQGAPLSEFRSTLSQAILCSPLWLSLTYALLSFHREGIKNDSPFLPPTACLWPGKQIEFCHQQTSAVGFKQRFQAGCMIRDCLCSITADLHPHQDATGHRFHPAVIV